jgi:hypothetical protein
MFVRVLMYAHVTVRLIVVQRRIFQDITRMKLLLDHRTKCCEVRTDGGMRVFDLDVMLLCRPTSTRESGVQVCLDSRLYNLCTCKRVYIYIYIYII